MPRPSNILVVRLTSLGDVLLATPAVRAIKRGLPEARISWLVEGSVGGLLAHQGFVDRVIQFPRSGFEGALKGGNILTAGRLLSSFRRSLREEHYDLLIDFHGIMKSAVLAMMAKTHKRIGFDSTFAKEGSWMVYGERIRGRDKRMHKVERNMLLTSSLGLDSTVELGLAPSGESDRYVNDWLAGLGSDHMTGAGRPMFAVNPFCSKGSEFKRWDLANYARVIAEIGKETNATIVILWGPGEEEEARTLREMSGGRAILACPTTVSQLLSLVSRMDLYIGGDTGVMHMAALAGTPVVAIFGPTDHLINGPYGEGHVIVRNEQPCSPCRDKSCEDQKCIRSVRVEDVISAVRTAWKRQVS